MAPNINDMDQRDTTIECLRNLDLDGIKQLCQSSTFYRDICNTPLAQQIIKQKYAKDQANKELPNVVGNGQEDHSDFENITTNGKDATYNISDRHKINIHRQSCGVYKITEQVGNIDCTVFTKIEGEDRNAYNARWSLWYEEIKKIRELLPKVTPEGQQELAKESILVRLFGDVKSKLYYDELSVEFSTTIVSADAPDPQESIQIGNADEMLGRVLEGMFMLGKPEITRHIRYPPGLAVCPSW